MPLENYHFSALHFRNTLWPYRIDFLSCPQETIFATGWILAAHFSQDPISDFMGPDYRPAVTDRKALLCPPFLHRRVYGDQPGLQEWRLYELYDDHYNNYVCDLPIGSRLPSPHNKGEEWYTEVQQKMEEFDASGWPEGTQRFWKSTSV
jgi:hypothetical protein